jgi:hypothetical protein
LEAQFSALQDEIEVRDKAIIELSQYIEKVSYKTSSLLSAGDQEEEGRQKK